MGNRIPDITDIPYAELSQLSRTKASQPATQSSNMITLSPEQLQAIMAQTAHNVVQKHSAAAMHERQVRTKISQRRSAIAELVGEHVNRIAEYVKLSFILENQGKTLPKLSAEQIKHVQSMQPMATESLGALEQAAQDGDAAQQIALEQAIDEAAASEDPAAAMEIIQAMTDDQISPEEFEAITDAGAGQMIDEASEEEPSEESEKTSAALNQWAQGVHPVTASLFVKRSQAKAVAAVYYAQRG